MAILLTRDYNEFIEFTKNYQSEKPEKTFWETRREWRLKNVLQTRYENQKKYICEKFLPYLKERGSDDMQLCDFACACGDFTFLAAPFFKHADGYDISPLMIDKAKQYALENGIKNVSFHAANALDVEFEKSYGAFMMLGLLTYMFKDSDALSIIKKAASSISGGGILLIKDSLTDKDSAFYYSSTHSEYTAIYRAKSLYLKMFESCGFELIDESLLSAGEDTPEYEKEAGLISFTAMFKKN